MIYLETAHKIIAEVMASRFSSEKSEHIDVKVGDFDGSSYKMHIDPKDLDHLTLSVGLNTKLADFLKKSGMENTLKEKFGSMVETTPTKDYDITLKIKMTDIDEATKNKCLNDLPNIKRYIMMAPFVQAFDKFEKGQTFDPIRVPYREDESLYIVTDKGSLIVIVAVKFRDPDDIIMARTFLQEFKDGSKGKGVAIAYTQGTKPLELKNVQTEAEDASTGFVSIVLDKRHIAAARRERTIDALLMFRNYLHYHLKCTKAYMHFRMRDRVAGYLQILNRAKVEDPAAAKEKKTASGRTFVRKP